MAVRQAAIEVMRVAPFWPNLATYLDELGHYLGPGEEDLFERGLE